MSSKVPRLLSSYRMLLKNGSKYCTLSDVTCTSEPKISKFHYSRREFKLVRPAHCTPLRDFPRDRIPMPSYVENPTVGKQEELELKNEKQIKKMRNVCQLARKILDATAEQIKVGVTTDELDKFAHEMCIEHKCYPSPLFYNLYYKSICTSVNNVMVHGIPDVRPLYSGDIINIDVTIFLDGYHGDLSETYLVGNVDGDGKHLVDVARQCQYAGISVCGPGQPMSVIGDAISMVAESEGLSVVPDILGHGIGTYFHGPPDVIHVAHEPEEEVLMQPGMTFTIEPLVCEGSTEYTVLKDGWTCVSNDGGRSAQFENTILITDDGAEVLTS
ncbi:methionine aminopeptidase 1D, mitochondrial-like isoform X2 [Mizuhopecten yessoensis]|uniref:Methionine aminopeptidase n=1 Tax=Mizuhopecten yessoensis TaxID=6573 RepID=A0A210R6R5_MIZYE|nr:methionine aminopeptidase 1D, mitochondrial-like isoform X2 [Mizuhopecten yessoensis]OWF56743.1 Methionine aminopeptidase 1D, mitochondrial [Mizuhopecten yessoensis]